MQPLSEDTFEILEQASDDAMDTMLDADYPLAERGPAYEHFAQNARAHAVLYLLVDGQPEMFFHDLIVSGMAWRHYLQACAAAKYRDYCAALGRTDSFFDAVAGDDVALALELIELAPAAWMKGDEYEEDFCFVRFLGLYAEQGNAAAAELDALLERFESALEGVSTGRLEVCRALRTQDRDAFEAAFETLVDDWENDCKDLEFRAEEEPIIAAGTQVFVEGLAVLRLAEREGLRTTNTYRGCPPLARRPRRQAPPADPFVE
jgi:hypothetical protein